MVNNWHRIENIRLYISLYSVDADFRKRWLPKAQTPSQIGTGLQLIHNQVGITLHWAAINNENDSITNVDAIKEWINQFDLQHANINMVRYNPADPTKHGTESLDYDRIVDQLSTSVNTIKIVPKVGFDVSASCGMFV